MHHVAIAEKFELRRSSRAEVSQTIATIHYDRLVLVEGVLGIVEQTWEGQMDRAANGARTELMRGQHVDDPPPRGDYLLDFTMIDDPHQFQFYVASRCAASRGMAVRAINAIIGRTAARGTDYFLVTSCRMSTCGRPSRSAPIAPPKAFI
jgi:hypothetical protein